MGASSESGSTTTGVRHGVPGVRRERLRRDARSGGHGGAGDGCGVVPFAHVASVAAGPALVAAVEAFFGLWVFAIGLGNGLCESCTAADDRAANSEIRALWAAADLGSFAAAAVLVAVAGMAWGMVAREILKRATAADPVSEAK
jgi:hypothetical protein